MERRSFLKNAGTAGVLAAGTAPAIVHAQQNIRWRLASSFPKSLDAVYGAAEVFARNVSEATGGKFAVSVHAAGELVPAFGVLDAVQQARRHAAGNDADLVRHRDRNEPADIVSHPAVRLRAVLLAQRGSQEGLP